LHECSGRVATRGKELLENIARELAKQERTRRVTEIEKYRTISQVEITEQVRKGIYKLDPASEYRRLAQPILEKHQNPDWSKVDWMVARELARRGWTEESIGRAIREASPNLAERKVGHIDDYVTRTAIKAVEQYGQNRDLGYGIGR